MSTPTAPIRVILDTNVWISGIFFARGAPAQLLRAWRDGRFEIIVSPPTLRELEIVLKRKAEKFGAPLSLVMEWLAYIEAFASTIHVDVILETSSRDPKDDIFLSASVAGQVKYLVTGDKDLLVLERIENSQIITPRAFLDLPDAGG